MIDISKERFFGAKAAGVGQVGVVKQLPLGPYEWQLLQVDDDLYQVLADETRDVLASHPTIYVEHLSELGEVHGELVRGKARAMGAEQSNTNLVVGDTLVKVFRKLDRGLNPDVEILSRIDNPHVAPVTAYVTLDDMTLAMQQQMIDGDDGFVLATAGAELDSHALGAAIASVHTSLADEFGVRKSSTLADALNLRLTESIRRAPVLEEFEAGIRARYEVLNQPLSIQRVHGDLHLGQTLKRREGAPHWYLIDFEGEPARPLAQRREPDHRLRDLAGMVRSYGYARHIGNHSEQWEHDNVAALKAGYGDVDEDILAAYIADKAAYEVVYEANNRPDWVDIPLSALRSIVWD